MRNLFTYLFLALIIGLIVFMPKIERHHLKIQANKTFIHELKVGYLAYKDSSEMRKEALRKAYREGILEKDY